MAASWSADAVLEETGEEAVRNFKKGEEVETVVLSIDAERERISLGIKQLSDDPFNNYVAENDKGAIVKGTVKEVDAKAAATSRDILLSFMLFSYMIFCLLFK